MKSFSNSLVPDMLQAIARPMMTGFVDAYRCLPERQWVKSLWPSDAIWRHGFRSILPQAMACCLTVSYHYLNQCWLITSKVQLHTTEGTLTKILQPPMATISLNITYLKFHTQWSSDSTEIGVVRHRLDHMLGTPMLSSRQFSTLHVYLAGMMSQRGTFLSWLSLAQESNSTRSTSTSQ